MTTLIDANDVDSGPIEANLPGSNLLTLNGSLTNDSDVDVEVELDASDGDGWSDQATVTPGPGQSTRYSFDRDVGGLLNLDQYTVTASVDGEELESVTITSVNVLNL